jgi:outer membrane usher protein
MRFQTSLLDRVIGREREGPPIARSRRAANRRPLRSCWRNRLSLRRPFVFREGLEYSYQRFRTEGTAHQVSITATSRISRRLNLIVSVTRGLPDNSRYVNDVFVGLNYFFGHDTIATTSVDHGVGNAATVSVQKPLPLGNGYGYLFQAREGYQEQENVFLQYQNDYGRYEADYTHDQGQNSDQLSIAGGLVAIGGRVIATRPVQDGYALVRVPGLDNIPAEWRLG